VSAKGAFWLVTYPGALTGERFAELLKKLMQRRRKPLHLILDGLSAHRKANVKNQGRSMKTR
jgi:transposase